MKDLIIIGGGPAGITAGIYGARKNLDALLLSKDFIGQLGNAGVMENWPGEESITGPELLANFRDHLEEYEVDIEEKKVSGIKKEDNFFKVKAEDEEYEAKAVIVTTGRKPRQLNVPGEEDYVGKGVSYCVTCDGALFRDKKVVIVGGGNAALEGALELSEYTKKITMIEISEKLQADELLIERVSNRKNIDILKSAKVKEIKGEAFVKELICEDLSSGEIQTIEVDGIFVQIGSVPTTGFLNGLVDYNEGGEIKVDPRTLKTKTEGLFAAGDVTNVRDKQVVIAAGEGCKALLSAYNYIKN